MQDFSLTTPALLFPTVSLLMLAYTNRFLTLATIIRNLNDRFHESADQNLLAQIDNLRKHWRWDVAWSHRDSSTRFDSMLLWKV